MGIFLTSYPCSVYALYVVGSRFSDLTLGEQKVILELVLPELKESLLIMRDDHF